MMNKMRYIIFFLILFGFSSICMAGAIAPGLMAKLSKANPAEKINVLISPTRPPSTSLKAKLFRSYKTRGERHIAGITSLKSNAKIAQAGLMEKLGEMESQGLVSNIKSHWIINVISADVSVSDLENIARRDDVDRIFQLPEIRAIGPVEGGADLETESRLTVEPNLIAVGADSAWALGYDGTGRIICSFDTGIDGDHVALHSRWKGLDGDSAAAWYDPIDRKTYPHVFAPYQVGSDYVVHGTHTMGIMVGYDSAADYYCGVAPGARWISAATINLWGASIIDAFEWAADPDGDPNSLDDVPDVINHSWGVSNSEIGCDDYFWQMIDNTEALGIVNIFAAGNAGSGAQTIDNPANRADDSLDCFAVGSYDYRDSTISSFSSRGPSECDGSSIKPNVVAPGEAIRSSVPLGYDFKSGTSMAAPHVSGAVAILRQYAPNATPDEIKEALLASCRSNPGWGTLPNNDFGWGMIYIPAAMEALSPTPESDLKVYSFEHTFINPGEAVSGYVVLKNLGLSIDSVYGLITTNDPRISIIADSLYFGTIGAGDTVASSIQFEASITYTTISGTMLSVDIELHGAGGYQTQGKLYIQVGNRPQVGFYTHHNDSLRFTVSNFGQFGFNYSSFYPLGYYGFRYGDTTRNDIWEAAFMIGIDSLHVSDGARTVVQEPDNDFAVSPGGDLIVSAPGGFADQETFSIFNDSKAENPMGLEIQQKTLSWNNYPDQDYVILEYVIKNISDSLLENLYSGLFFDWEYLANSKEGAGFVSEENLGYVYYPSVSVPYYESAICRGISVINSEGASGQKILIRPLVAPLFKLSESEKYQAISTNTFDSLDKNVDYFSQVISTGPFTLPSGEMDTVVFAISASDTLPHLISVAAKAKAKYINSTDVEIVDEDNLPVRFSLSQNYPNPFNPTTQISFSTRTRSHIVLSVYNILGEKITMLLDKTVPAGTYSTEWDGRDRNGREVASGLYFYRLSADDNNLTRKMILLK